ncbi:MULTISPECIES: 2-keto-4-pentenoate hydratase [unclassified Paenibacillus]|uniref:2-keto-4-pentenoate hydratase n=1 Tax=unclassified Paenibacillus TaxID=185978 RepID=UPI001AE4740C|nr:MULTISPECIES: 2-keto-4-pentenoate hydratase [unclassified Paenibacillus]MBP1157159.1 2-keto-4-pentenoate hydratase [Paenibacillus sp. PvP091]MBP1172102.1 2-keto-4-pentenoate hydratase [Paenibacillus sp. PvR098]MBP2438483.1 2-keto-4-pentenoate hydratase [Paenibacillus sp. PvP052]
MNDKPNFQSIAQSLYDSFESKQAISPITETYPSLAAEDAYQIQRELIKLHQQHGRMVIGNKIGLTSEGIQKQLNVYEPDFGVMFSEFAYEDGAEIDTKQMIYPRIEAEIAFILDKDLKGPNLTAVDVLAATKAVVPSFEIIDSRVKDWKIKISDTIADNGSHWGMVLGSQISSVDQVDFRHVGLVLERDGKVLGTAAGAAVLGHPARSVAWLANKLSEWGETLKAGSIVLSGSLTPAFDLLPGRYKASFGEGLSSVEVNVK